MPTIAKQNNSGSGFIDEPLYMGQGTCLQSQREGMETRINEIIERFERIISEINEWENSLKNRAVPVDQLNRQFSFFSKVIKVLSNQALLANVSISICGAIVSLKDVIAQMKPNGLKGAGSQIDKAILCANLTLDKSFCHKLNLSTYILRVPKLLYI